MKWILSLILVAGSVQAQTGGYQLFSRDGNSSSSPGDMVASIPLDDVLKVEVLSGQSLTAIVPATVNRAESILRRMPPANATNAQRMAMQETKGAEVLALIQKLPGTPVNVSIIVEDVVRRTETKGGNRMVVGRINWQSAPVQTDEDRKALADLRKDYEAKMQAEAKRYQNARQSRSSGGKSAADINREKKKEIEDEYQATMKELKAEGESERPVHMVYILGDNEEFDTWRRGQTRTVKGVIQEVGLFVYNTAVVEEKATPRRGSAPKQPAKRGLRRINPLLGQEDVRSVYVGFEASVVARTN